MRTVGLLRHAKSSWDDDAATDRDRALSTRGLRDAPRMGAYMAQQGIAPDLVLCSSARRTRQTFDLIAPHVTLGPVRFEDDLYLAEPEYILRRLRQLPDAVGHVLVIGHNPGLELLALDLAGDGDALSMVAMRAKYPTAGLAVIDLDVDTWSALAPGLGHLRLFMAPKRLPSPPREAYEED